MLSGIVFDTETQSCLVSDVNKTNSAFERMRGLLFRKELELMQALWIEPCPSIHTIGMTYAIDVIFLDKNGLVLKVIENLAPLRMAMCKGAIVSLEMRAGSARRANIQIGLTLTWKQKDKIK